MRIALIASFTALAFALPAQEPASPEALEVASPEALEAELEAAQRERSALEDEQDRAETLVDRVEETIALEQQVIDEQIESLETLTTRLDTLSIRAAARRARVARLRAHVRRALMPLMLGDERALDPQGVAAVAFGERTTRQIAYLEESLAEIDRQVAALNRERERMFDRITQAEEVLSAHAALHGERAERLAAIRDRQAEGELYLGWLIDELNTLTPTVMLPDAAPVEMIAPQLPPPGDPPPAPPPTVASPAEEPAEDVLPVVVTRRGDAIDIETHPGAVVRAPRPGEVIYAGALEGFGQVVILDHGEGLLSIAASLDGVGVDVGDRVDAGQAVATAGMLRESGVPGLHFEVRRGSDVLDAVDWLGGEDAVGSLLRP